MIGLGGTGAAAATALAGAGIGTLTINDFDSVDESNLARQTLYGPGDVGMKKAEVARERLVEQNPAITIEAIATRLTDEALKARIAAADIVLDCCDNFASRFAINRAAVETATALVTGAAIRWQGQVNVFGPDYVNGPCYQCLYQPDDESLDDCQGAGVLGPLPPMIGQLMAIEAIKLVAGTGARSTMWIFDAQSAEWQTLQVNRSKDCVVCG